MENIETNNVPKLVVNFEVNGKNLEVDYKVNNTTSSTIYLFNVVTATGSIDRLSDQPFYSCLRDDGTLVIGKMIPPVPKIRSVEMRQIPLVTKVEAGATFAEKVAVALPVDENSPYFPKLPDSKVELRKAESIVFILQFIREKEGLELKETKISNAFKVWHKDLFGNVETLRSDPRPSFVEVNRRIDTFERF